MSTRGDNDPTPVGGSGPQGTTYTWNYRIRGSWGLASPGTYGRMSSRPTKDERRNPPRDEDQAH